jgi:serine/threonine-protein kinase
MTYGPDDLVAGRFRLGRVIGAGAQGRVVAAHDELLDRPVALKILQFGLPGVDARARFLREARAAAGLLHPNVVTVFDVGAVDGSITDEAATPYLAMELVDGPSLAQVLAERGPLAVDDAVEATRQVLAGLAAAHARGLLHRDVKPSNALLAPDGTVKLTDFGIATGVAGGGTLTQPGAVLGTVAYLAPERLTGEPATVASDLYGVGVMLHEMLVGEPPYTADTAIAVALAHRTRPVPSVVDRRPEVGPGLDALVRRALAKDPADRYGSAADMDLALAGSPAAPQARRLVMSQVVPRAGAHPAGVAPLPGGTVRGDGRTPAEDPGGDPPDGGGDTRSLAPAPARARRARLATPAVAGLLALVVVVALVGVLLAERDRTPSADGVPAPTPTGAATAAPTPAPPATTPSPAPPSAAPAPPAATPAAADPLDALIARLAEDPDAAGERGDDLLARLTDIREADPADRRRLVTETAVRTVRWVRRGELDPTVGAEVARVLGELPGGGPLADLRSGVVGPGGAADDDEDDPDDD